MLSQIVKPFAELYFHFVKNIEKKIGFGLSFDIPDGWINNIMIFSMGHVWKKFGIDAEGINYFTVGNIQNNISSRFIPESKYYQAWLGGYLVKFSKKRDWTINNHFSLAEADQLNWLKYYGDPKPNADIQYKNIKNEEPPQVNRLEA